MADVTRRGFIGTATATAAILGATGASADDESNATFAFKNNVPDPLLSGPELPNFRFALEKSEGKRLGGSFGKEATVRQLPISKGLAGVSMRLEPGVIRELHWHATAAEWAYVLDGQVRTTVVSPDGQAETNDFEPGDVWYFPRGHPHMLQCRGDKPCHFILVFDNGYFSEFGTFSITDWMGHTPKPLLAKNFDLPASTFDGFPHKEVYFAKGTIPPEPAQPPLKGLESPPLTHKFRLLAQNPDLVHKGGKEWMVDATKFPISETITGVILELEPGGLRELHWHPTADEWDYVITGDVSITLFGAGGRYKIETFHAGDVGFIPQGYGHSIENIGEKTARLLIAFNTGRYSTVNLSQWIAGNPPQVLATNFGKPEALFEKFPKEEVFIAPE